MPPAPPRHLPPRSPLCLSTGSWSLRGSAGTASEQWSRRHRAPRLHGYTSILRACDARAVRHCAHSGGGVCVYVWGGAGQPHCKVLHLGAGRGRTPGGVHLGMPPRTGAAALGKGSNRQAHCPAVPSIRSTPIGRATVPVGTLIHFDRPPSIHDPAPPEPQNTPTPPSRTFNER